MTEGTSRRLTDSEIRRCLIDGERKEWDEAIAARAAFWAGRETTGKMQKMPPGLSEEERKAYLVVAAEIKMLRARVTSRLRLGLKGFSVIPSYLADRRAPRPRRLYLPREWKEGRI
jgi:hypothetical protein